jgi:hypothetical protein
VELACARAMAMMVDGVHFGEHTCMVALGDRSSTELGTSSINWSERVYCMQVLTTSKNPPRSCPFGERRRAIRTFLAGAVVTLVGAAV